MKNKFAKIFSLFFISAILLASCAQQSDNILTATGTLSAVDSAIAPEISGKVTNINVQEGDTVTKGQVLFVINSEFLTAQHDQAAAAVAAAEAAVAASQDQAASAEAQYQLALQGAIAMQVPDKVKTWDADTEDNYRPAWYYTSSELVAAAQSEVDAAIKTLDDANTDLTVEQQKVSSKDFLSAETRLAEAQAALSVAQNTLDQADATNNDDLQSAAQELMDTAQAEFDSALSDYERMLTTSSANSIIEARARVSVAQAALDNSRAALMALQTGDQSLQVIAAEKAAEAASSAASQAEAGLAQAQQAEKLAQLQLDRSSVTAPFDGVVTTRNLEIGELAVAGGTVMRVAQLNPLELIVYLPEDQYGLVNIGDEVSIRVDSYTDQAFTGQIINISDEAEYTPRNVQTEDGRKATVFAIKIQVENPDQKLKPGMSADVEFTLK